MKIDCGNDINKKKMMIVKMRMRMREKKLVVENIIKYK
jgi:hypothetical protein